MSILGYFILSECRDIGVAVAIWEEKQHGLTQAEILKCLQIISNLHHYRVSKK